MSEHDEQAAFFDYCDIAANADWRWLNIFAVPNAEKRSYATSRRRKKEGLRAGVPDVVVAVPSCGIPALFIEFKFGCGKLTQTQLNWRYRLLASGYAHAVPTRAEQAIKLVRCWMAGRLEEALNYGLCFEAPPNSNQTANS